MGPALNRRRFLAAAAALGVGVLGGCTGGSGPAGPTASHTPTAPDPLLAVLTEREALVTRYDAVGAVHPALLGRLQPLRAQTGEQVETLRLALALPTATTSSPPPRTSGSSASVGSITSGPGIPLDPAAALAELRTSVQAGAASAATLCLAIAAERAPLVGSLAAAGSCHDLLLA